MKKIKPGQTRKPRNLIKKQMIEQRIDQNNSDSMRDRRCRRPLEEKNAWREESLEDC